MSIPNSPFPSPFPQQPCLFSQAVSLFLFCKFICIIALTSHSYPLLFHPVLCPKAHLYRLYASAPKPMASDGVSPWEPWQKVHQKDKGERRVTGYCSPGPLTWQVLLVVCSACPQPTAPLHVCPHLPVAPPQPHLSRFLGPGVAAVLLLLALGSCSRLCTFPIPHPLS